MKKIHQIKNLHNYIAKYGRKFEDGVYIPIDKVPEDGDVLEVDNVFVKLFEGFDIDGKYYKRYSLVQNYYQDRGIMKETEYDEVWKMSWDRMEKRIDASNIPSEGIVVYTKKYTNSSKEEEELIQKFTENIFENLMETIEEENEKYFMSRLDEKHTENIKETVKVLNIYIDQSYK